MVGVRPFCFFVLKAQRGLTEVSCARPLGAMEPEPKSGSGGPWEALLDSVPSGLDIVSRGLCILAVRKSGHFGPESTSANWARHQVRRVETEGRGICQKQSCMPAMAIASAFFCFVCDLHEFLQ